MNAQVAEEVRIEPVNVEDETPWFERTVRLLIDTAHAEYVFLLDGIQVKDLLSDAENKCGFRLDDLPDLPSSA